ncbi:MAG: hypothetical protein FJY26_02345 [Betaproteobacteria bacterium]|nr:hypothetical protein [Betaproteobacteria bacterium]
MTPTTLEPWQQIPEWSSLARYAQRPHYADHFYASVPGEISIREWTEAFFCSDLFRSERFLLNRFVSEKATDVTAHALGAGASENFSAWRVEQRDQGQILLQFSMTRTWLAVQRCTAAGESNKLSTRLYLGSAVLGAFELTIAALLLRATLASHRAYSRALLRSGQKNLQSLQLSAGTLRD